MTLLQQLQQLSAVKNETCVSISLNTHRTHPDNKKDEIVIKNLLAEAEKRLLEEHGKRSISGLMDNLKEARTGIDTNHLLDSLHIFSSNSLLQIVRTSWPVAEDRVEISNSFATRGLIKAYNRSTEYLIMVLSQSGVTLYNAVNDTINKEFINKDFPFAESKHYNTFPDKGSDAKHIDNLVREFLNGVDKAANEVHQETGAPIVVICTEDNYSRLLQVADKPGIYLGYAAIDYNNTQPHEVVKQAWTIVHDWQKAQRTEAINNMKAAISSGKVVTDLQEIYQAAIDGRGELLIIHQDYSQSVRMIDDRSFELIEDASGTGAIDDIISNIAWEVLSRKGQVVFTQQEEFNELGKLALKVRY